MSPKDKVFLITGANAGIGLATAQAIAGTGAHTLLLCRTSAKAETTRELLMQQTGNTQIEAYHADLASQTQIRAAAAAIRERHQRLDVLINNAGVWKSKLELTEDQIESTLAVNHLAYFLFTHLMYPLLHESGAARIINVSSDSHFQLKQGIHFDDPFLTNSYHGLRSYAQSKLANILFTYEFERRKPAPYPTINAVQPGLVQTDIGLKHTNWLHALAWKVRRNMKGNKTPAQGAATSIYLAIDTAVAEQSGQYWDNRAPKRTAPASYDQVAAQRLWEMSCDWCGITDYFSHD